MKKMISMLTALALVLSLCLIPTCSAYGRENTKVVDLGNGITVETTTTVYDSLLRSSTQKASSTSKFKNNGELIATVTLTATFGYDGSRAWVVSASGSHSMESGWTYSNQSISKSGGTANLTADIKSTTGLDSFPVDISLTCSKDGDIS